MLMIRGIVVHIYGLQYSKLRGYIGLATRIELLKEDSDQSSIIDDQISSNDKNGQTFRKLYFHFRKTVIPSDMIFDARTERGK